MIMEILNWWFEIGFIIGVWGTYNDKEVKTIGDFLLLLAISSILGMVALLFWCDKTINPILNIKIRK